MVGSRQLRVPIPRGASTASSRHALKLAIVLWNGDLGGAELLKAAIARTWIQKGVEATIVFVSSPAPLARHLELDGTPYLSAGLKRGRGALVHPRRLARLVAAAGPDGALLVDSRYLATALRAGGYDGRIVAVEHGEVLEQLPFPRRLKDRLERWSGARCRDVDVGVSDLVVNEIRRRPHARTVLRIHNGVDTTRFAPSEKRVGAENGTLVVGAASRLVPGKGIDQLLRAVARLDDVQLRLEIAGDGPERGSLFRLAEALGVGDSVEFRGRVLDMPRFWRQCDLAVIPSHTFVESFSMTTLEAMACGLPVVATRNGGIPEVLADGEAGTVVPPGDPAALAAAMHAYAADPDLRRRHAVAARDRACRCFAIEATAGEYLDLFARPR